MESNTNLEVCQYKAQEFYNNLPESVKLYLKSDVEDILRLGVDYVNNTNSINKYVLKIIDSNNKKVYFTLKVKDYNKVPQSEYILAYYIGDSLFLKSRQIGMSRAIINWTHN